MIAMNTRIPVMTVEDTRVQIARVMTRVRAIIDPRPMEGDVQIHQLLTLTDTTLKQTNRRIKDQKSG